MEIFVQELIQQAHDQSQKEQMSIQVEHVEKIICRFFLMF